MSSNPKDQAERPSIWYAVFAWGFTGTWIGALLWTSLHLEYWPLWARALAIALLILTTPAGSDLFLLLRMRRNTAESQDSAPTRKDT